MRAGSKSLFLLPVLFLCISVSGQNFTPETGSLTFMGNTLILWETPEGSSQWVYQQKSEGYLIWQEEDGTILWAWPETGGRSYLFQGAQWFPFILLEKGTQEYDEENEDPAGNLQ